MAKQKVVPIDDDDDDDEKKHRRQRQQQQHVRHNRAHTTTSLDDLADRAIVHPAVERVNALPWWKRVMYNIGLGAWLGPLVTLSDVGMTAEEIEQLKMMVPFSEDELHRLCHRFLTIDTDRSGRVSFDEFMKMDEFKSCPFRERLYDVLDSSNDHTLTFIEFVQSLSVFSERSTRTEKVKFLFKLYDCDGDNRISREDLRHILSSVLEGTEGASGELVDTVIEHTFEECNATDAGFIDFAQFSEISERTSVESFMRINW